MNSKYGHLTSRQEIVFAQDPVVIDGSIVYNPTKEQYLSIGEKEIHENIPQEEPEHGKYWEEDGWEETETELNKKWKQSQQGTEYREFSKYKILVNLQTIPTNGNDLVKTFIDTLKEDQVIYELWNSAMTLNEGDLNFKYAVEMVKEKLGLSDEQIETILSNSIAFS